MIRAINLSPFTSSNSRTSPSSSRLGSNNHRGGIHHTLINDNNSNDSNQFFDSGRSSSLHSSLMESFGANDDCINSNTNNSTTGLAARSSVPPAVDINAAVQSLGESTQLHSFVAEIQSRCPEFDEGKKLIAQAHRRHGPRCGMTGRVCHADSHSPNVDEVLFAIILSFCVPDMERMLQMKNRHEFVNPSINTVYRLHVRRFMQFGLTEEEAEDFVLKHSVWIDSSTAEAEHDWRTHRDKKPSFIYLMETLGLRKLNATMHKSLLEHFPNLEIIVGFGEEAMEMLDLLREYFPQQIQQQRIVHHPSQVYNGMLTKAQLLRLLRETVFRVVDVVVDGEPTVSENEVDLDEYARTTKNSTAIEVRSLAGKLLGVLEWKADVAQLLNVSASTVYHNTDDEGVFSYFGKAFLQLKKISWTNTEFGKMEDGADDLHRIIQEMAAHRTEFFNPVEVKSLGGMTLAVLKSMSNAADLLGVSASTVYNNTDDEGKFTFYGKACCQIQRTDRRDFGEKEDSADDLHQIIQEMAALRGNAYEVCTLDGKPLVIVESMPKAADLLGMDEVTVARNSDDEGVFTYYNREIGRIQRTDRDDFGKTDFGKTEEGEAKLRRMIEEVAASRKAFFARKGTGANTKQKGKGTDKKKWEELNYIRVYKTNGKYIGTAASINNVSEWIHVDQEIIDQFLQTKNDGVLSVDDKTICRLEKVMIGLAPGGEADLEEIREATSAIATNSFDSNTSASPSPSELTDVTKAVSAATCAASISSREATSANTTKVIEGEGDMAQKPAATATTSTSKTTNLKSISIPTHTDICTLIPDEVSAIKFLTTHGVFSDLKEIFCAHCGHKGCRIKETKKPKNIRCNQKSCSKGQSLVKGTLFANVKVPLHQALYMARYWLSMESHDTVIAQLGCSSASVTKFFGKFRTHIKKCVDASPNEGMGNRDPEQIERDLKVHIPRYARKDAKAHSDHLAVAVWRDMHENNLWNAFLESLKTVKYETEAVVAAGKQSAPETDNKRKASSEAGANATKNKRAKQRKD
jgi:hypothetical protein